jgi:integrase
MTVRKRKNTDSWVCDFYYNGERIIKTLRFARTKKEAEQAEAVIRNQVFQQAYGFDKKPDKKFEDFVVETYLPYSETNKKSFYSDVLICRVLVRAFTGKSLRQITPAIIERFKQEFLATPTKHGEKRSLATVNNHLRVLSKVFSLAVDDDFVESNPCFRVRKFRLNNQRMRVLSAGEERELMIALEANPLVRQIVTVALHTGLRRGEIFGLTWDDLDFERELIKIQETKSGKKRMVPMNAVVRSLFQGLKRQNDLVFPSPRTGKRLHDIKKTFRQAVESVGLKDFRFHDLRHTAATRMADGGADAFTLAKILGHSNIQMTARYTHATDAAIRRAVANLETNSGFSNKSVTKKKRQEEALP